MTSDPTPVPAAPTPKTYAQIAAIWGANALIVDDLTVVQYGGLWSVVTGHRLPTAEIWQETTP